MSPNESLKCRPVFGTDQPFDGFTVDEQDERRYALHTQLSSNRLVGIDVDLGNDGWRLGGQRFDCRFHHLTRATPVRVAIDQHW